MNRHHYGGVALVSILLVVALATIMAVSMITEQRGSIQVTRGFLSRGQASQYALGGEELARQILAEDFLDREENPLALDTRLDNWASDELHFEFEDGEVNLQITDLQGFANVNNLLGSNQAVERQRLNNLLAVLGIDVAIADRLADWIDEDSSSRPAGAEDYDYLVFDPPYRTPNAAMVDVSEIFLLGLEPELAYRLQDYISALPDTRTALNINTAPPVVLQSLSPQLSFETAQSLAERRDEQEGFESVELFLQAPELAGLGVAAAGLGVQSSFFEVRVIARYQDRFSYLTSVIQRNATDGSMRVIKRDFSRRFRPDPDSEPEQTDD